MASSERKQVVLSNEFQNDIKAVFEYGNETFGFKAAKTFDSEIYMNKQDIVSKSLSYFDEGYACSQAVLLAFAERFDLNDRTAKLISSTFGGGMGRLREKCGAITGGFMVLGLAYGNADPEDMETKLTAYKKVRELNLSIKDIYGTCSCDELLKKHATEAEISERKHRKIICRKVVGDVTGLVFDSLEKDKNQ